MACHTRGLARRIVVWARRPKARQECARESWCHDAPEQLEAAVAAADLVVLCPPVAHILPLLRTVAPALKPGAIVTDVGSTKATVCGEAPGLLPDDRHFVGAHPMAGSEKSGMAFASADLFEGRPCFVTPTAETSAAATDRVEAFWQAVGMRTHRASPEEHDALVAHLSHLPHLLASALAVTLGGTVPNAAEFAGDGLRDTSRVAAGSPSMWRAICEHNQPALLAALGDFRAGLEQFEAALRAQDFARLEALLATGRDFRLGLDRSSDD